MAKEIIQSGLTITNLNLMLEKGKSKKDGIYCFRGVYYKVINGFSKYYAYRGDISQFCYGFMSKIGTYDNSNIGGEASKKALKQKGLES